MNFVAFLIGFSSLKINNDEGPSPGGGSSFFLRPILLLVRLFPPCPELSSPEEETFCCPASAFSEASANLKIIISLDKNSNAGEIPKGISKRPVKVKNPNEKNVLKHQSDAMPECHSYGIFPMP